MFEIAKLDEDQRLVFGYANVAAGIDGRLVVDVLGDVIDPDNLEQAAYDFVLQFGGANVSHTPREVGRVVESFVVTPEKLAAMGLQHVDGAPRAGWWVGFKVDPETFARVKAGELKMFSIEGTGERVPL